MAIRFQPSVHEAQMMSKLARLDAPTYQSLPNALLAMRDYLGPELLRLMATDDPLMKVISGETSGETRPETETEALAAFVVFLVRLGALDDGTPPRRRDRAPVDVLQTAGRNGLMLSMTLQGLTETTVNLAVDAAARRTLMDAIDGRLEASERMAVRSIISPRVRRDPPLPPLPAVTATNAQGLPEGHRNINATRLAGAVTYGSSALIRSIQKLVKTQPKHPLTRSLNAFPGEPTGPRNAGLVARLLRVLWNFRDPHQPGAFQLERFAATYGDEGRQIVQHLAHLASQPLPSRVNYSFLSQIVDALGCQMGPRQALPLIDALVRHEHIIPKTLPVLEVAKKEVAPNVFRDQGLVAIQHQFVSLIPVLEAYHEKGMRYADMHVLGTPYASNPLVASYARLLGVRAEASRDRAGGSQSFEDVRLGEIARFLTRTSMLGRKPDAGWVVLDDGGLLNAMMQGAKEDPRDWMTTIRAEGVLDRVFDGPLWGVEQTTRGLTELAEHDLGHPVVAVARAPGKGLEGRLIGWSTVQSILRELRWRDALDDLGPVAVVSAGTVGLEAARRLRDDLGLEVVVVDNNEQKRARAEDLGFETAATAADVKDQVDLIFSATGKRAIDGLELQGYSGYLASGSSAAIELDTEQLLIHDSDAKVLNWGRPINFPGDGHELLSPLQIGITQSLLFLGAAQQRVGKGLVDLDEGPQQRVIDAWRELGGDDISALNFDAKPQQPPDLTSTDRRGQHDEWMTYFMGHGRAVFPPPTTSRRTPGLYFFRTSKGQLRFVDTAVGRSYPAPFDKIPTGYTYTQTPLKDHRTGILHSDGDVRQLRYLSFERGKPVWSEPIKVGEPVAATAVAHDLPVVAEAFPNWADILIEDNSSDVQLIFQQAFLLDDKIQVVRGDIAGIYDEFLVEATDESQFIWWNQDTLLQIDKATPQIRPVGKSEGPAWTLPPNLARIDVVSQRIGFASGTGATLILGKDTAGATVVVPLSEGRAQDVLTLPEGAAFRGLDDVPGPAGQHTVRVRYLEAGGTDELSQHTTQMLSWSLKRTM